jgi:hypothetical protein
MPKKRKVGKETASDLSDVFVLTLEECEHSWGGHHVTTQVVGVCNSKEAAVADAGDVDTTGYGLLGKAVSEMDWSGSQDNRDNAPDCGVLLQLGSQDEGEGDYVRLLIKRFSIVGMHNIGAVQAERAKARAAKEQTYSKEQEGLF